MNLSPFQVESFKAAPPNLFFAMNLTKEEIARRAKQSAEDKKRNKRGRPRKIQSQDESGWPKGLPQLLPSDIELLTSLASPFSQEAEGVRLSSADTKSSGAMTLEFSHVLDCSAWTNPSQFSVTLHPRNGEDAVPGIDIVYDADGGSTFDTLVNVTAPKRTALAALTGATRMISGGIKVRPVGKADETQGVLSGGTSYLPNATAGPAYTTVAALKAAIPEIEYQPAIAGATCRYQPETVGDQAYFNIDAGIAYNANGIDAFPTILAEGIEGGQFLITGIAHIEVCPTSNESLFQTSPSPYSPNHELVLNLAKRYEIFTSGNSFATALAIIQGAPAVLAGMLGIAEVVAPVIGGAIDAFTNLFDQSKH